MTPPLPCGHREIWDLLDALQERRLTSDEASALRALEATCEHCRRLLQIDMQLTVGADTLTDGNCPPLGDLEHAATCLRCSSLIAGMTPSELAPVPISTRALQLALATAIVLAIALPLRPRPPSTVIPSHFVLQAMRSLPNMTATAEAAVWTPQAVTTTQAVVPQRLGQLLSEPVIIDQRGDGTQVLIHIDKNRISAYALADIEGPPIWEVDATQLRAMNDLPNGTTFAVLQAREWADYAAWMHEARAESKARGRAFLSDWGDDIDPALPMQGPLLLGSGDIDGDGRPEVMVRVGTQLVWLGDLGLVVAHWGPKSGPMWPPAQARMADLDGDGVQEVIAVSSRGHLWRDPAWGADAPLFRLTAEPSFAGQPVNWRGLSVFNRDGTLRWRVALPHVTNPRIADITGDGLPEVLVTAAALDNGYQIDYAGPERDLAAIHVDLSSIVALAPGRQADDRSYVMAFASQGTAPARCVQWLPLERATTGIEAEYTSAELLLPPDGFPGAAAIAHSAHFSLSPGADESYQTGIIPLNRQGTAPRWHHQPGFFPGANDFGISGTAWSTSPVPSVIVGVSPRGEVAQFDYATGAIVRRFQLSDASYGRQPVALYRHAILLASGDLDGQPGVEYVVEFTNTERPEPGQIVVLDQQLQPLIDLRDPLFRSPIPFSGAAIVDTDGDTRNELLLIAQELRVIRFQE